MNLQSQKLQIVQNSEFSETFAKHKIVKIRSASRSGLDNSDRLYRQCVSLVITLLDAGKKSGPDICQIGLYI